MKLKKCGTKAKILKWTYARVARRHIADVVELLVKVVALVEHVSLNPPLCVASKVDNAHRQQHIRQDKHALLLGILRKVGKAYCAQTL